MTTKNEEHHFLHCEFEYKCPKNWFELEHTDDETVKYCRECEKQVYYCCDQEDIDFWATRGQCVAYISNPSSDTLKRLEDEAEIAWSKSEPIIVLGLPSRRGREAE